MPSFIERVLILPGAVLALCISQALGYALEPRDSTPSPISFEPDQNWDGIDGSWSTFTLRVGTPAQYVRTSVSWAGYQTWVVIPDGCIYAADNHACSSSRGGTFDSSASSTWKDVGIYEFGIEQNLNYTGNAAYGYDVVGLGAPGGEGPTVKNTTVGGFAVEDYWLGVFGINPKPTNFTSFNEPSTSYLTLLKEQDFIPSLSFGYTAGAPYRFTGELASLTLGGYDSSKFIENDVTWTFAPDNSRDTVVAIQGIITPSQIQSSPNPTSLLPTAIYAYLDATVPQIWLPVEACMAFEAEFGLIYNSTTELYLVNDTLHQSLLDRNASVTFTLGQTMTGGPTVSIQLPYAAFDLTAKAPYQGLSTDSSYFPLRRAANDTQYTLGRTFFQEAYISVDYETRKFNVSQCAWNEGAQSTIVAIPAYSGYDGYSNTTPISTSSSEGLTTAEIAGIAVGVVAGAALVAVALFFFLRRRIMPNKRATQHEKLGSESGSTHNTANVSPNNGRDREGYAKAELDGDSHPPSERLVSFRAVGSSATTSGGTNTPRSPHPNSGSTWSRFDSSSESPISPAGEGTHSSSQSNGVGTMFSAISPSTPISGPAGPLEADSRERVVYEMVGDMPVVREKDGHELNEKEALAYREKVYNGVETPPASAAPVAPPEYSEASQRRSVNPEDVATSSTVIDNTRWPTGSPPRPINFSRHRAFSFEDSPGRVRRSHEQESARASVESNGDQGESREVQEGNEAPHQHQEEDIHEDSDESLYST